MSGLYLDDLPTDKNGKFTRQELLKAVGFEKWFNRKLPFVSVYCGSSPGRDPAYVEAAIKLGKLVNEQGWVLVNGGGTSGLMVASNKECERTLSFTTRLFSVPSDDPEKKEGLNPNALNVVLPDFFERKVCMDLLSDICFVMPGGFGTLDEALEAIIFAGKANRKVVFVNVLGIWNPLQDQFKKWAAKGLMPKHYTERCAFVDTPEQAVSFAREHIATLTLGQMSHSEEQKPAKSLRAFLSENGGELQERISDILHDFGAFAPEVPRIGVIASGNIGPDQGRFNFETASQRDEICRQTDRIGRDLAKRANALAIIPGSKEGLREIVADAITARGGRVLWIEKSSTDKPLDIKQKNDQELRLIVARHYEVDRLTTLLSTGIMAVCGGPHTADRVFGYLTRNQTGHGCYSDLVKNYDPRAPRPVIHCYSPALGNGEGFWTPLQKQLAHCVQEGFASPGNMNLIVFSETARGLVAEAIEKSWDVPTNMLFNLSTKKASRPRETTIATAKPQRLAL